jgi:hypothetical protein
VKVGNCRAPMCDAQTPTVWAFSLVKEGLAD